MLLLAACGGGDASSATTPTTPTPPVDNTPSAIVLAPAGSMTIASGSSSTITATVQAKDGHALAGQRVAWSTSDATVAAVSSSGTVSGTVSGAKIGSATITATSGSLSATVVATVIPGAATALAIRTQPGDAASGSALSRQPVIELRDAAGNLSTSTATVTASIASGGGTVSGGSVSAVAGVATFTNLAVAGAAGARTLSFSATGASAVTSSSFTITPSTTPTIVLDSAAVTLYAFTGVSPAARTLGIVNGGAGTLSGLSVDAVSYDAGATGWLSASLGGSTSPTLTLTPSGAGLANGSYHATVTVRGANGAAPATLSVTLVAAAPPSISYANQSAHIVVTPIGTALQPTVSLTSGAQALPPTVASFTSRATTVLTVDAAGRITPVAPGAAFVVAQAPGGAADSIFITVLTKSGPVLLLDLQKYSAAAGEQLVVTMSLDTRGTSVGSFDAAFGYPDRGNPVRVISYKAAAATPAPVVNSSNSGSIRVSWASASGSTGVIPLLQVTLQGVAGDPGYLTATLLDIYAPDLSDLLSSSTPATLYPIRVP